MTLPSPPWKLRVERREVRDEERPVGVIVSGPVSTMRARSSRIQGNIEEVMPITVNLYPELPEGNADDLRDGRLEASRLKSQINNLMAIGLTIKTEEEGRRRDWAGPMVLPLWDYDGVDLTGKDKAGPDDPHDTLWIVQGSLSTNAIQDVDDPRRWSVICNFRISIERPGRVPDPDEIADITEVVGKQVPHS